MLNVTAFIRPLSCKFRHICKYKALYSVFCLCNFISKNKSFGFAVEEIIRESEFAENANRAAFMNIHIVHGFYNPSGNPNIHLMVAVPE